MTRRRWRNRQPRRQLPGIFDTYQLLSRAVAADNAHRLFRHRELRGEEFNQVGIGPAFDRRRGKADFQSPVVLTGEFIAAGARLQMAGENQCALLPAVKRRVRY